MKKNIIIIISMFIITGITSIITNSCKKDDDVSEVPTTVTDIDGNIYTTVTIGSQVWMVENLRTTKYCDSSDISAVFDSAKWRYLTTGAYCNNYNDSINSVTYGRLYNWYAVNDIRNIAPEGWHVPTDAEWTKLETYLITHGYNFDGSETENKIAKSLASANLWELSTLTGAVGNTDYQMYRDKAGFKALPGGYRGYFGMFNFIGVSGRWWSTTETSSIYSFFREINFDGIDLIRDFDYKHYGFSVRCLMD